MEIISKTLWRGWFVIKTYHTTWMLTLKMISRTNKLWWYFFVLQYYLASLHSTSSLLVNKGHIHIILMSTIRLYIYNSIKSICFRRFHSIRTLQINLIDLRLQFIFCNLFLTRAFLDQAFNISIIYKDLIPFYKELGKEEIFNFWWLSYYLENIGSINW